MRMSSRLAYRADLDGLRAVAIVPVVLFHLGITILPGGFVGVDVFFVLSGYLITSLIVTDLKRGTFSLIAFYDRRIRRIVPASAVVLVFCAGAALLILFPSDLNQFGVTLAASGLALSNVVFARQSGYFAPDADLAPLLHTWSLAVEEQFYVLFPVALWAMWRWAGKWLPLAVWLVLVASLALSIVGVWKAPTPAFYLLPTRAWELLMGSILALELVPKPSAAWQREFGAAVGVLAILAAMAFYTEGTSFPGIAAIVPCSGAALVIWAGTGRSETWTARLLATSVPVAIGLISYSLYLWHWPLIVFAKLLTDGRLTPSVQLVLAFAAIGFAVLTWHYIERPLRIGGWTWPTPRHRFFGTGLVLVAFVVMGVGINLADGLPQRLSRPVRELVATKDDFNHLRSRCHGDGTPEWTFAKTCVLGSSVPPRLIVFADSHGAELSMALGDLAKARHLSVRQVTASGCPPAVGFSTKSSPQCAKYMDAMLAALLKAPRSTVVVTAFYFYWSRGGNGKTFWGGLDKTVRSLRKAGHSVVLLGAVPPHPRRLGVPSALARWVSQGNAAEAYRFPLNPRVASDIKLHLARIAKENGAVYVPLVSYFCPSDRGCQGYKDGTVMYFDHNHMSVSGAKQVAANILAPVIWSTQLTHDVPSGANLR